LKTPDVRTTALCIALTLALGGCTTTGTGGSPGRTAAAPHAQDSCRPGTAALGGAVGGALIQALRGGDGRSIAQGAAVGAAVAAIACLAINAQTRRTMDAQTVATEFQRERGMQALPADPTLLAYETTVDAARVEPGTPVRVASSIKVVDGSSRRVDRIEEHLVLLDREGKELRRFPKDVAAGDSGAFENTFTFRFPQAEQGVYGVRTELWLNGQKTESNDSSIQLVMGPQASSFDRIASR